MRFGILKIWRSIFAFVIPVALLLGGCSLGLGQSALKQDETVGTGSADSTMQQFSREQVQGAPTSFPDRPTEPTPTYAITIFDHDGDGWMTYDEYRNAVGETLVRFEWPSGYAMTVDDIIPPNNTRLRGARFEVGMHMMSIGVMHRCVWWQRWIDAFRTGDETEIIRSLQEITEVVPYNPQWDASTRDYYENLAQQAALGNAAPLIQFVETNCSYVNFVPFPATPISNNGT